MRLARILAALVLLAALSGSAYAQNGCARLSWGTCNPWLERKLFNGPAVYTLVESMFGVSTPNVGTDSQIRLAHIPSAIPDAWRFDVSGCQAGRLALDNSGLNKSCPPMLGANPNTSFQYVLAADGTASLRMTSAYDVFAPSASTRYTIWKIVFDHTHSVAGPSADDQSTCGGAEQSVTFVVDFAYVIAQNGQSISVSWCDEGADHFDPCAAAEWNAPFPDGAYYCPPPVAALPATWGRVKSLYR